MDAKISEFPVAPTATAAMLVPVVVDGINKILSLGILTLNLPNLGNKGITKNVVIPASVAALGVMHTIVTLPVIGTAYTLQNGSDGQEIMFVSLGNNTMIPTSSNISLITMVNQSTVTLVFIATISKWVVKSAHNVNITNIVI